MADPKPNPSARDPTRFEHMEVAQLFHFALDALGGFCEYYPKSFEHLDEDLEAIREELEAIKDSLAGAPWLQNHQPKKEESMSAPNPEPQKTGMVQLKDLTRELEAIQQLETRVQGLPKDYRNTFRDAIPLKPEGAIHEKALERLQLRVTHLQAIITSVEQILADKATAERERDEAKALVAGKGGGEEKTRLENRIRQLETDLAVRDRVLLAVTAPLQEQVSALKAVAAQFPRLVEMSAKLTAAEAEVTRLRGLLARALEANKKMRQPA